MPNADDYTYHVFWSEEDGEYVGIAQELPGLSHLDATPERALQGIMDLVSWCLSDTWGDGIPIPAPLRKDSALQPACP